MGLKDIFKDKHDDKGKITEFKDKIASKVSWDQMRKRSGSAFKTHYAVIANPSQLVFRRTFFMKFLPWLVILFSIGLMFVFNDFRKDLTLYTFHDGEQYVKAGIIVFMLLMGIITRIYSGRHIIFDRRIGFYHKGWGQLGGRSIPKEGKNCAHLQKIYAIQIISEIVRSKNSRYRSYELNLVLNNGNRVQVIDHSDQESVRKDAQLLSKFLEVPVWDITVD